MTLKKLFKIYNDKSEDDIEWITVRGAHIPIKKGENKQEAIDKFLESKKDINSEESLKIEAKKYASAEKFVKSRFSTMAEEILTTIEKDGGERYGLRIVAEKDPIKEGDPFDRNSIHQFDDSEAEELGGVSTIGLNYDSLNDDEENIDAIITDIIDIKDYFGDRLVVVKGDFVDYGSDDSEVILANAEAIKLFKDTPHDISKQLTKIWENGHTKKNASQMPKVYYCRHIEKGVVGYEDEMVLVNDDALNKMDKTMSGIPVRVQHVDEVDVTKIQEESDGYVSESFYLECDGWHWAKFICVSDDAHDKIQKGWSVSNAYTPTQWGGNGAYHNIPYDREILNGQYGHLAIVPNPRYEDAFIMTQEQFKEYKDSKQKELKELQNTKKEKKIMFKIFKKVPVEKEIDDDSLIQLENGKEMSLKDMVATVIKNEKEEDEKKETKMNMDSEIDVGDEKMTVKELVNRYKKSTKKNAEEEDEKKNEEDKKKEEDEEKKNMSDEEKEKEAKKNAEEEEEKKKEKKNALDLKEADLQNSGEMVVETSMDKLARGSQRYGS